MITFNQLLTEIFDNPYKITRSKRVEDRYEFNFTDDAGIEYGVAFMTDSTADKNIVDILLFARNKDNPKADAMSLTGAAKSPTRVYATIGQQLKYYIAKLRENRKPIIISFSSVDRRTMPLYRKLADRIAKELNGTVRKSVDLILIDIPSKE